MNAKKCYDEVGLVAYWPFDGDDNDQSGNGYHLANSSLIWTNGVNAKAAYFNGTFNSPIIKSLTVSTSMTVALWAKPKKVGDTDASILMGRGSFGLNFRNFAFILQGGFGLSIEMQRVLVFKDDNCYLLKDINLADGWHHIAVSVSGGGKPTLYIDGVMISDVNVVAFDGISISSPTVGGLERTGQNPYADQRYAGFVDDLIIYNRALSATEIEQLYRVVDVPDDSQMPQLGDVTYSSTGLVGFWPFEGNGKDVSRNAHTIQDSTITWRNGVSGRAAYFDGLTSSSSTNDISVADAMTIAFWAKPQKVGTGPSSPLIGPGSFGYNFDDFAYVLQGGVGVSLETHRLILFKDDNCYLIWNGGELGAAWHHYTITINSGIPTLYVDGDKRTDVTSASLGSCKLVNPKFGGMIRTGQNPNSDQRYKGFIDELFIYNRVLSEAEIKALCVTID